MTQEEQPPARWNDECVEVVMHALWKVGFCRLSSRQQNLQGIIQDNPMTPVFESDVCDSGSVKQEPRLADHTSWSDQRSQPVNAPDAVHHFARMRESRIRVRLRRLKNQGSVFCA